MAAKRVLICAPLPRDDRDSGSRRILDHIIFLQEAGWTVSLVTEHCESDERYVRKLQQRGVTVYLGEGRWLEQLVKNNRFDLAIVAWWYVAERCIPVIRRFSPATLIIVDSVDLHFLRGARQVFSNDLVLPQLDAGYGDQMRREVNTYAAADSVMAVSEKEANLIGDLVNDSTRGFAMPDNEELEASPYPFGERRGILFIGFFNHLPNVSAVEYLTQEILPRIENAVIAEHPVYVVGSGKTERVQSLIAGRSHVHLVGWVPSLLPYLQRARISVIPLLYGAGTKRKMIQALMVGTPTVSTSIGMEGLGLEHGKHVLVADDPTSFAQAITRLLQDEVLWQSLSSQGREHIRSHNREAARARFLQVIESVSSRKPKPSMLIEQTAAS